MDYCDFYPKQFHEIIEQDNPFYSEEECYLLVGRGNRASVLYIPKGIKTDVIPVALFFKYTDALEYCNMKCGEPYSVLN